MFSRFEIQKVPNNIRLKSLLPILYPSHPDSQFLMGPSVDILCIYKRMHIFLNFSLFLSNSAFYRHSVRVTLSRKSSSNQFTKSFLVPFYGCMESPCLSHNLVNKSLINWRLGCFDLLLPRTKRQWIMVEYVTLYVWWNHTCFWISLNWLENLKEMSWMEANVVSWWREQEASGLDLLLPQTQGACPGECPVGSCCVGGRLN